MLRKFFTVFLLLALYGIIPVGAAFLFKDQLSDNVIMGGAIVMMVLAFPYFFYITKKVFTFKAKTNNPIDEAELLKKISELTFQGTQLKITKGYKHFILSPPNMDKAFIDVLRSRNIKHTYEMKLWFNDKKHSIRFQDRISRTAAVFNTRRASFRFRSNSGFVSFNIKQLNDEGELVSFSNGELHEALIKVVTENGWDLSLRVI